MASIGVSKPELARLMGMSPQNIFAYFQRDDMRLSLAQRVVDRLGYELSFSLERETQSSLCEVEIELPQGMNRLAFLRIALQKYGISRKDLAEKLGLNYTVAGETNLIGVHANGNYNTVVGELFAILGLALWAEYLDGIAVITVTGA